jgi:hypothetical protein
MRLKQHQRIVVDRREQRAARRVYSRKKLVMDIFTSPDQGRRP